MMVASMEHIAAAYLNCSRQARQVCCDRGGCLAVSRGYAGRLIGSLWAWWPCYLDGVEDDVAGGARLGGLPQEHGLGAGGGDGGGGVGDAG
jgi:hypothetical protein